MSSSSSFQQATSEVSYWLHDQQRCVTIGGMTQALPITSGDVSRSKAASLLQEAASSDQHYQATYCQATTQQVKTNSDSQSVKCTVFSLVKKDFQKSKDTETLTSDSLLYSLALKQDDEPVEDVFTAHERDAAQGRDQLYDQQLETLICPKRQHAVIAPSPAILTKYQASVQAGKDQTTDVDMVNTTTSTTSTSNRHAPLSSSRGPKKTTTAASFFQSTSKTNTKSKTAATKSQADEKENEQHKKAPTKKTAKKVGNADDFVGDMDEDDDDDDEEQPVPEDDPMEVDDMEDEKSHAKSSRHDDGDDDSQPKTTRRPKKVQPVAYGAMDSFATAKPKAPEPSMDSSSSNDPKAKRRRRKKTVEKTSMDQHGYLITETQEVWEDVPSDEEEEKATSLVPPKAAPIRAANKKKTTNKSGLKQGNLMGFFGKK